MGFNSGLKELINSAVFHIYHVTNWWFQWHSSSVSHYILYLPFAKLFFFANVNAVNEKPLRVGTHLQRHRAPQHRTATVQRELVPAQRTKSRPRGNVTGFFFLSLFVKKKMHWRPRPSVRHVFVKSGIGVEQKLVEWVSSKSVEWRW
jgi:hypothetical protein